MEVDGVFSSRDGSSDVFFGPMRYADALKMPKATQDKITGIHVPIPKDALKDTAAAPEREPSAPAPSTSGGTSKQKVPKAGRQKKQWRKRHFASKKVKLSKETNRLQLVIICAVKKGKIFILSSTELQDHQGPKPLDTVGIQKEKVQAKTSTVHCNKRNKIKDRKASQCPSCGDKFASEDEMLDHFLAAHRANEGPVEIQDRKTRKRIGGDCPVSPPLVESKRPAMNKEYRYSRRYLEKSQHYPSISGTVAGFSVEEWNTIAQILSLTWLLGVDGFYFFIEQLLIEMSVDFSRLKLLLSGDIEQNPGPDQFHCHWDGCKEIFNSLGYLSQHVMERHSPSTNICKWRQCAYWDSDSDYSRLESHILCHIYLEDYKFTTIQEWIHALPNRKINPTSTGLNLCPKHLVRCFKLT